MLKGEGPNSLHCAPSPPPPPKKTKKNKVINLMGGGAGQHTGQRGFGCTI